MIRKTIFIASLLLVGILPFFAGAETISSTVTSTNPGFNISNLSLGIPGTHDVKKDGLPALVANIYDLALAVAGILAFGSIVYGGILYLSQPGSVEAQAQAKERIRDAVLGLLLLIGLYLVLNVVNPDLTNLRFPVPPRLQKPVVSGLLAPGQTIDPKADVWACETNDIDSITTNSNKSFPDRKHIVAGYSTQAGCQQGCNQYMSDNSIVPDTQGFSYLQSAMGHSLSAGACELVKGAEYNGAVLGTPQQSMSCGSGPCVKIDLPWEIKNGDKVDPQMLTELQCIANKGGTLRITEAMPPTVVHQSTKHMNGCAVDATIPSVQSKTDCSEVCAMQSIITGCGGTSLNEYFSLCANTSCPGTNTEHATADHIHINSCF